MPLRRVSSFMVVSGHVHEIKVVCSANVVMSSESLMAYIGSDVCSGNIVISAESLIAYIGS